MLAQWPGLASHPGDDLLRRAESGGDVLADDAPRIAVAAGALRDRAAAAIDVVEVVVRRHVAAVRERGGGELVVPRQRRRGREALPAARAAAPARVVDEAQHRLAGVAPVAEVAGEERRGEVDPPRSSRRGRRRSPRSGGCATLRSASRRRARPRSRSRTPEMTIVVAVAAR
jgi:hypothetical protein